mgnify:CR=1 FL=1
MSAVATSLGLMRRLPPAKVEQNLSGLLNLLPDDQEELLQRIDQPLEVTADADGKKFLVSDYNRDGDSHRSPWSNKYEPPLDDGFLPSAGLREMEVEANYLFDNYRELYFDGGYSSVYFWDLDEGGFAACFLIKKVVEGGENVKRGSWDGIHVIEVTEKAGSSPKQYTYKLTSTVILNMNMDKDDCGKTSLAGSVTRQAERVAGIDGERNHVGNMGSMVEDMESDMRQHLLAITYVEKMGDILRETRNISDGKKTAINANATALNAAVLGSAILGKKKEEDK